MENSPSSKKWFEELFDELENSPMEPNKFLDVENYPEWVLRVAKELFQQSVPSFEIIRLKENSPMTLGLWLGQNYANLYALVEMFDVLEKDDGFQKLVSSANTLEKSKQMGKAWEVKFAKFLEIVKRAFDRALEESYAEALDFFQGFTQGLSKKGITAKGLARETTATPVYLRMYCNWQVVDKLTGVPSLYLYLQKIGLPQAQLGDIERLSRLCTRVKYHPGKRGRPMKPKNRTRRR